MGKGENAGNHYFLVFPQCCLLYQRKQEGHDGPGSLTWVISPTNEFYIFVPLVPTCDLRRGASFDSKGHHVNKIDKGLQGDATYRKSKLYLFQFQKKNFEVCLLCSYVPTCDHRGGINFDLKGIIWTKLIKIHKEMLNTKYQSSNPSSFREEEFWSWFSLFLCSNLWPPGWGQFWPHEHHMNKLGRCPQGDAKNQISKLYTFLFLRKRILKMGFFVPMFQLVTPGLGPILTLGASYEQTW